jgi:allantoinase
MRPATIHIVDGRITRLGDIDEPPGDVDVLDAGTLIVLPGVVDTHVHVNEPGRTEWEGFASATRAAVAGGVTTLVDMPLNSIPATTSVAALQMKSDAALAQSWADVGFLGGVVPGNTGALAGMFHAGVLGFKCFLTPSGVEEFPPVDEDVLRAAMPVLASLGSVLMVHAEDPVVIAAASAAIAGADRRAYATYLASRPAAAELEAIARTIRLCEETGARVHIVHVSSAESVALLRAARSRGLPLTAETCPHYLTFHADEVRDGATEFKCAPPIRDSANRDPLWEGLMDGTLDAVVSDHSPCPPAMKKRATGDFFEAWGGIASLQLGLSATWSGMRERGIPVERIARWMSEAPARLVRLDDRKGRIAPGFDADFVLFDPDAVWVVNPPELLHRHPVTPYAGRRLTGRVEATYLRGMLAYDRVEGPIPVPQGRLLLVPGNGDRDSPTSSETFLER